MAGHTGWILGATGGGLLEFEGSGGNKSNEPPENEATQNGKTAAPQREQASSPEQRA